MFFLQAAPAFPSDLSMASIISWIVSVLVCVIILLTTVVRFLFKKHLDAIQKEIDGLVEENKQKHNEVKELNDYIRITVVPIVQHNNRVMEENNELYKKILLKIDK